MGYAVQAKGPVAMLNPMQRTASSVQYETDYLSLGKGRRRAKLRPDLPLTGLKFVSYDKSKVGLIYAK